MKLPTKTQRKLARRKINIKLASPQDIRIMTARDLVDKYNSYLKDQIIKAADIEIKGLQAQIKKLKKGNK